MMSVYVSIALGPGRCIGEKGPRGKAYSDSRRFLLNDCAFIGKRLTCQLRTGVCSRTASLRKLTLHARIALMSADTCQLIMLACAFT